MSDQQIIADLEQLQRTQGGAAVIEHLIARLRDEQRYHQLFDALLMKKKLSLGLPLSRPTSFDDVPADKRDEFEEYYIAAAREIGEAFLKDGGIRDAWVYLRTIREPQKVAEALEALPKSDVIDEELLDIAFFQGVNPSKGIQMMLASHGTCSTITALDQQFGQMTPEARVRCAGLLVAELYRNLRDTVQQEVQKRQPMLPPNQSLRSLIAGRDWLFADENYHIDVSHLNSVVRFGRALNPNSPELEQAQQLAEYGAHLSERYQYAGSAPFEEFYPAHIQFFKALRGDNTDEALAYFRDHLARGGEPQEQTLTAFTLVDLLLRLDRLSDAADLACEHLRDSAEEFGISIAELCQKAGRRDTLLALAREKGDVLAFAGALVQGS